MVTIAEIPIIPDKIKSAAENGNLIIFVGAGVSRLVGSPNWEGFADGCLKFLVKKRQFNYSEYDQLKKLDTKKKLSIALKIAKVNSLQIPYKNIIQPKLLEDKDHIYKYLKKFDCPFVTTNYDDFLSQKNNTLLTDDTVHSEPEYIQVFKPDEFSVFDLNDKFKIIHIHGALIEPESMIITTSNYLQHYSNERVKEFLKKLFDSHKIVLFIGYGLEELEVLEYVVGDGHKREEKNKHFLLQGFYSHQELTFNHLKNYYRDEFGIELISFSKDSNDYNQLTEVVKEWSENIDFGEVHDSDELAFILEAARG